MRLLHLLLVALLLLPALAFTAPALSPPDRHQAQGAWIHPDGTVVGAEVSWSGGCHDLLTLTVVLDAPESRTVTATYDSVSFPECWAMPMCYDCPPLPLPFAWTMQNTEDDSMLVGAGALYYDRYTTHTLAWNVQGPFDGGVLEFGAVLWK